MLYFLHGEDWFRLRERKQALIAEFEKKHPTFEHLVFDMSEGVDTTKLQSIHETLSGGLFAQPKALVLDDVSALTDETGGKLKNTLSLLDADSITLVMVISPGKIKKTAKLNAWLLKKATTEEFLPLTRGELARYAETLLKELDSKSVLEKGALDELLSHTGSDTGKLSQELSKLILYADGKKITREDVKIFSEEPLESNIFLALDALVRGRREQAIALFRREEAMSVPVLKTLGLCAWQIRQMIMVKEIAETGKRDAFAIARELKASPYSIQKVLPLLSHFSFLRLKSGIRLLADLDMEIKNGRTDPGVALDLFVWKF